MSVQTEIDRIVGLVNESHDKARAKGGTTTPPLLANLPKVIDSILQGVELPELGETSAQPTDIAVGKVLYDDEGNPITGTLPEETTQLELSDSPSSVSSSGDGSKVLILSRMQNPTDFIGRSTLKFHSKVPTNLLGNAELEDVVAGQTFTSAAGLLARGTHVCKGVELPNLGDKEASASDLAIGKQLIDDEGNIVEGAVRTVQQNHIESFGYHGTMPNNDGTITIIGQAASDVLLRPGSSPSVTLEYSKFGNATAADVLAGRTFTSIDGMQIPGELEVQEASSTVVQIAEATPSANSLTLTFNGLSGEPTLFSINPKENITLGSTRYILGVDYDGSSTMGTIGYSSGSFMSSSATATYSASNFTWEYADGTLTVTSNGATTGGYFMNGITYQLTYITDTLVQGETGGTDTSDATAVDTDILKGKTAYVKGVKVTGKIESQATQTITPGTADKSIPAGKYLSGMQIIKGDSNLKAENIKKGVSIFGVSGSLKESSGTQIPDGAVVVQVTKGAEKSTQVGSGYSLSISYADAVEINDSIALAFVGTAKNLSSISDTTDFSVLLGKYIRSGSSTANYKYYYIPDDATFTVGGQSYSKTLTCDKAQLVSIQKVLI